MERTLGRRRPIENHGARPRRSAIHQRRVERWIEEVAVVREEDGERVALGASDLVRTKGRRGSVSAAAATAVEFFSVTDVPVGGTVGARRRVWERLGTQGTVGQPPARCRGARAGSTAPKAYPTVALDGTVRDELASGVTGGFVRRRRSRRASPRRAIGELSTHRRYRACWVTVTDEKKAWEKKRRGAGDGDADDVVPGRGERGCAARLRPGSSPLPVGCSTTCSPAIAAGGGERSGHRSVNRFQPVGGKTSPPVPHAHGRIRLPGGRPPGDASRRATRPPRASLDRRIGSARS